MAGLHYSLLPPIPPVIYPMSYLDPLCDKKTLNGTSFTFPCHTDSSGM
ncbi:hypothetical protein AVEN_237319-1, partial [Araneus ventricosus]